MKWFLALSAISGLAQGETCVTLDSTRYYYRRMESNRAEIQLRLEHDSSRNVLKLLVRSYIFSKYLLSRSSGNLRPGHIGLPVGRDEKRTAKVIMRCMTNPPSKFNILVVCLLISRMVFISLSAESGHEVGASDCDLFSANLHRKLLKETISS